jgi:DNA-binding GntR family transcriptional regulator
MLTDFVTDQLLAWFVDGRFSAGESLSIDKIAQDLDVSPTPVRESLARLEATGLVTRVALKGYSVTPQPEPEEIGQLMDARRAIEPVNARKTARRMTPELLEELRQAIDDHLTLAPTGPTLAEFRPYWEADERFHRLIAQNAGNPYMLVLHNTLSGQLQRFRLFGGLSVTDAAAAIAEHTKILEALSARDAAAAGRAMDEHLLRVKKRAAAQSASPGPGLS